VSISSPVPERQRAVPEDALLTQITQDEYQQLAPGFPRGWTIYSLDQVVAAIDEVNLAFAVYRAAHRRAADLLEDLTGGQVHGLSSRVMRDQYPHLYALQAIQANAQAVDPGRASFGRRNGEQFPVATWRQTARSLRWWAQKLTRACDVAEANTKRPESDPRGA
jgi:hypothetical protein